jgi:protein-S-isoprenylcysteine O-methyltransferase Ste14
MGMTPRGPFEWLCAGVFKLRGVLIAPLVIYALAHYEKRWERSFSEWALGLVLFFLGMALRVVAQRHLRYRVAGTRRLAQGGPYRYVRNPVYVANVLILAGLALAAELPYLAPILAVWAVLVYHLAVLFEEKRLEHRYGDEYGAYCAQVPRWLPRSIPLQVGSGSACAPWHQAFAVEWHCLLLLLVPVAKEIVEHCWPALLM